MWTDWLPKQDEITNDFWRTLVAGIITRLRQVRILHSWEWDGVYQPSSLKFLVHNGRDAQDEPLFVDLFDDDKYLDKRYSPNSVLALRSLGLEDISYEALMTRLDADTQSEQSTYKAVGTDDAWHTRVADLVQKALATNALSVTQQIRGIDLIPLVTGSWVAANDRSTYFSEIAKSTIPRDLGLQLVSPGASFTSSRRRLFGRLGVMHCTASNVLDLIRKRYASRQPCILRMHHHSHIYFLYENSETLDRALKKDILLRTATSKLAPAVSSVKPRRFYFSEVGQPYSACELLGPFNTELESQGVHILAESYFTAYQGRSSTGTTLRQWFSANFSIRSIPCLLHHNQSGLSAEFQYIARTRPDQLVGTLKEHWSSYDQHIHKVLQVLQRSAVPTLDGNEKVVLADAYLPLPRLISIVSRAGITASAMFLQTPTALQDESADEWRCLAKLGVGMTDDTRFYLTILSQQFQLPRPPSQEVVFNTYKSLMEVSVSQQDRDLIR